LPTFALRISVISRVQPETITIMPKKATNAYPEWATKYKGKGMELRLQRGR